MEECCKNCKLRYKLVKLDYSEGGCKHMDMPGYICMVFADERIASWMYGAAENAHCECFTPINKK